MLLKLEVLSNTSSQFCILPGSCPVFNEIFRCIYPLHCTLVYLFRNQIRTWQEFDKLSVLLCRIPHAIPFQIKFNQCPNNSGRSGIIASGGVASFDRTWRICSWPPEIFQDPVRVSNTQNTLSRLGKTSLCYFFIVFYLFIYFQQLQKIKTKFVIV